MGNGRQTTRPSLVVIDAKLQPLLKHTNVNVYDNNDDHNISIIVLEILLPKQ